MFLSSPQLSSSVVAAAVVVCDSLVVDVVGGVGLVVEVIDVGVAVVGGVEREPTGLIKLVKTLLMLEPHRD